MCTMDITVADSLIFHWYLRTLSLKFQKAMSKIEVFPSLPCLASRPSALILISMPLLFEGGPYLRKYGMSLEFLTGGGELLWGNCTVFPVTVQGILTGGT